MSKLAELNRSDEKQAVALIAPLIERAPHIAKKVAQKRPFPDKTHLSQTIRMNLLALEEAERIALFHKHPELAPDKPEEMTRHSQSEQGRFNLTVENDTIKTRFDRLNADYRQKFGFPFITALVRHDDLESILQEFEIRLLSDRQSEIERTILEIATVCTARVETLFGDAPPQRPTYRGQIIEARLSRGVRKHDES